VSGGGEREREKERERDKEEEDWTEGEDGHYKVFIQIPREL
jgi:hypothetical protein